MTQGYLYYTHYFKCMGTCELPQKQIQGVGNSKSGYILEWSVSALSGPLNGLSGEIFVPGNQDYWSKGLEQTIHPTEESLAPGRLITLT